MACKHVVYLDSDKSRKVKGFQVAPAELEGCILDHPYAADVCVVGVPHPYNGEVPFAFVVLTEKGLETLDTNGAHVVKASIMEVTRHCH